MDASNSLLEDLRSKVQQGSEDIRSKVLQDSRRTLGAMPGSSEGADREIGAQIEQMREALAQLSRATEQLNAEQKRLRETIELLERQLRRAERKTGP